MKTVDSMKEFEIGLGNSIDICILEIEGQPLHNLIRMYSFMDFDNYGMVEVKPSLCYLDDFFDQMDIYKSVWDYVSDFSSYKIPLYYDDFVDPIEKMCNNCLQELKATGFTMVIMKYYEIDTLRKLNAGLYLVGFEEDEKVSQSQSND